MALSLVIAPTMLAFVPTPPLKSPTPTPTTTSSRTTNFRYYGDIAPLGEFDPLNIVSDGNRKFVREAELQHGRIAMLATLLIPGFEMMKPGTLGINYLSDMDLNSQLPFWYSLAVLEFYRMYTGWNSPFYGEMRTPFSLSKDYQPGNLLRLNPEKVTQRKYNTELSNGRLAMLAAAHMVGSELATGETLAQQLAHF